MDIHPEIRFTKPTPRCPNPERWHALDDQSTELEVSFLVAAFVGALQPDYVLETGSFIGSTSIIIGQALTHNGQGHLHSIELNPEAARVAKLNTEGLPVTIHQMSSMDFTPELAGRDDDLESIGFAWFDSLVTLRRAEFGRFYPYMRPGTICGFHDTAPHHGNWSDFLHPERSDFTEQYNVRAIHLPTPRGVTFLEVL
jgi:predicted O-methyltransferase YrrM